MMEGQQRGWGQQLLFWVSLALLLLVSVWWRVKSLHNFAFGYDEGIHLIVGKLWAAGYVPYQEIFVSYPPIFLWSLGVTWALFRQSEALQLLMVGYSLAGVLAVVYLGTIYYGRLAGIAAGLLLSFAPPYFISSFEVMTETPSIGVAVVAVALAEKYRRDGGWIWALLAGVSLAFALSLKVLPVYGVPFVGLLVLARHIQSLNWADLRQRLTRPVIWRDLAILAGGFVAVFVIPILFFDLPAFYGQVVGMRLESRDAQVNLFSSNNEVIINFMFDNAGLTALALYGLLFVVARRPRHYGWLIGWFVLTWVSMFLHIPLREKHLPIFLPMLALLAGFGLHHLFDFVRTQFGRPLALNTASILLTGLAALGMLIWHVPQAVALNNGEPGAQVVNEDYNHILPALDQVSSPDDCVIADNPLFLHYAKRLPPPELAEASQTRIETGYLTLNDITSAATNYRCHVVAVVTPRFGEYVSGVRAWLSENYIGFYERNDIELYFARIGADLNFEPLPETTFDGRIKLYGLRLNDQPWSAGESHYLSLYWQNEAGPINGDFEIITLQAADGSEVYRFAWPMLGRLFDPAAWPLGQAAKDVIRLDLPADLPAGDYTVTLSLCAAETGPCYSFSPTAGTDETRLSLGQITIKP